MALTRYLFCLLLVSPTLALAGFLDLPEITEVPELERKSLLEDIDIPPASDRDPSPDAGPRLAVSEFRLQGIVEYPELGITRVELAKIVEGIRFEMMDEEKLLKSGFSIDELAELSDLIINIEEELGDRHASPLELQRLVWLVREQRAKRGITLGMIETVADRITQYYRERGFVLAKAFIPEQKVRDGVVSLTLLLGELGKVEVLNNKLYSSDDISSIFDDMLDQPVLGERVEEKLYLANDFPGLSVSGFFEPGSQVGDTKLNINVLAEDRFEFAARLDNHGSEQSGENRFYTEAFWNNPFGLADQLQLGILAAEDPSPSRFGLIKYSTRLVSPRIKLDIGASTNDFVLGQSESTAINVLELEGKTEQFDINLSYALNRSRIRNSSLYLAAEEIESIVRIGALPQFGDFGLDDKIRNTTLGYRFDALDETDKILHQGDIRLTSGKFVLGQDAGQDENYNILRANYTMLSFWTLPWVDLESRVVLSAELQYAGVPLSSINQMVLGGAARAKGYSVNAFSADDAFYGNASLVFDGPNFLLGGKLQPVLFADVAYGRSLGLGQDAPEDLTARLFDVGVGLQLSSHGGFRGNLLFAFPVQEGFAGNVGNDDQEEVKQKTQVLIDIQYSF